MINHSYLNQIQKMNEYQDLNNQNPENNLINNIPSNNIQNYNNNLNLSFSSSFSGLSETSGNVDKFGKPICL